MADAKYQIIGPGLVQGPGGATAKFETTKDGFVFDTVNVPNGAPAASYAYFNSLANKNGIDTNLRQQGKIPYNQDMVVHRVGVYIESTEGGVEIAPLDIKQAYETASISLKVDSFDVLGPETPIKFLPPGFGLAGQTNANAQGIVTAGMPATELIANMLEPYYIGKEQVIDSSLLFDARTWITNYDAVSIAATHGILVKLVLYGVLVQASFNQ